MIPATVFDQNLLLRKIQRTTVLGEAERDAIMSLPWQVQPLVAGKSIVRRGDKPTRCFLIKDGFVSSAKSTNQGNDGITGIHIAGDMPDLFGLHLEIMDTDMRAATECTVAFVDHTAIRELCDDYPRLNRALWRLTLVDAAILREWIINVGHRPALVRLAHVFCEVMLRQNEVGRAFNNVCALPFTQLTLAEVTGMSTVHLNRSLQELRARKLIKFDGETLQILDFEALMEEADFEVDYLHLHHVPNFN